jgi:hypothetical protein
MCAAKRDGSELCPRFDPKEDEDAEEEDAIERGWEMETSTKRSVVEDLSEVFVDKDVDAGMTDIIEVAMALGEEILR